MEYNALALLAAMKQHYRNHRRLELEALRAGTPPDGSRFAHVLLLLDGAPSTAAALAAIMFTHFLMEDAGPHEVGNFLDELCGLVTDVEPHETNDGGNGQ